LHFEEIKFIQEFALFRPL